MTDQTDLLAAAAEPHDAVMWTPQQIADRDGTSKQAVTAKARKLATDHGLIVERDGRDRIIKLNVVQFDKLRGKFADPSHAQAPKAKTAKAAPAADSRDEAMRLQAWTDAERSRLALDELKSQLLRADKINAAVDAAGDAIANIIDRLSNSADDLAAAVARDGSHGLRVALTAEAVRLRREIAAALRGIAPSTAPAAKEVAPAEPVPT